MCPATRTHQETVPVAEVCHKDHMYDSTCVKCPEWANPHTHTGSRHWLPRAGVWGWGVWGVTANRYKVSLGVMKMF